MTEPLPTLAPSAPARRPPALAPVAAAFVVFGVFWGGWAVAVADIEHELHFSHARFGLLLSAALAAAGVANALGGALAERHGTGRVLAASLAVWAVLLASGALAHNRAVLIAFIIVTIAAGGLVDTVMNVAATAALAGRPGSLVRFHGLFNVGAAVGAATVGILAANKLSWRWTWGAIAIGGGIVAIMCARTKLPAGEPGENAPLGGALKLLRRERLVIIAIAFAVGAMVEGGIEVWGVLFLRTHLASGLLVGATSAVIAYVVAAGARVVFGPAAGRGGAARGVLFGASTAAAGVLILALAPGPWLEGAGLVIAAGGVSMCWPLLLSTATAARERPGAVVGAVSAVGYFGFFVGPTIVGWTTAWAGLRGGLCVLAVCAVFVAVAPNVRHRRAPRSAGQ